MSKPEEPFISQLDTRPDLEYISTGVEELDQLIGGFARGRITEIWGEESVGKTWLATKLIATMSRDNKVLYVDSEFALNKERVKELGADPKNIAYVADARLEQVCELIVREVGNFDVIILDSVAALTPLTVDTNEIGETSIGLFSRLLKHWVTKLKPRLAMSKTALVVVNQHRKAIGYMVKNEPPGGQAYHHAIDVRLKLHSSSTDKIVKDKTEIGKWIHVRNVKDKTGSPNRETKYKLLY